ncbi:hypothetical protein GQ54DRAFT_188223 [Martensiomyces pterosporus]|nr:hypothetical protein GQ54DRAFT_188223 [Martensiomyces pterosporus]
MLVNCAIAALALGATSAIAAKCPVPVTTTSTTTCLTTSATTSAASPSSTSVPKPSDDQPSLIVFGDSMSDNGSTQHYSNYSHYWGGRYSNSYMWNEYSAKLLNLNLENWAIGGSTTDNKFVPAYGRAQLIPSVADIVPQYIANNTHATDNKKRNSIIAIDGGGNDFFYSIDNLQSGKYNILSFVNKMVGNQIRSIKLLLDAGYRNIYLLNMPSLQMAPAIAEIGASPLAGIVGAFFDTVYHAQLAALHLEQPIKAKGVKLFDLQGLINTSGKKASLQALNITTVANYCVTTNADGSFNYCSDPDTRYYYDDFHPTGRPHYLIGVVFANTVKNPLYPVTVDSIRKIAKEYDIAHSDSTHNIIASASH